jgi:hypothetical protein
MSTNTSEQNTPAACQPTNMVEFVAFIPRGAPVQSQPIGSMASANIAGSAHQENNPLDITTIDFDNIANFGNIDNSLFSDIQVPQIYQRLVQHYLATQASFGELSDDTALSVEELQYEINAAKRGLEYREGILERYSQG